MAYNLTLFSQIQQLPSLENQQENYLPSTSNLLFIQNKYQLIYHGYSKSKNLQQTKQQNPSQSNPQQSKPKKKFVFKVSKDKQPNKPITQITQKLNIFSIQENKWSQLQIKGKIPLSRQNQQYIMLNQNILLMYGGKNLQNNKLLNDLHALNLQSLQWKKLFSIQEHPLSDNNLIIKINDSKVILVNLKYLWTFEAKDVKWQLNTNQLPGGLWQNINIKFENLIQADRQYLLSGISYSQNQNYQQLLIFSCDKQTYKLHSYLINISDKQISKLKMQRQIILDEQDYKYSFGCFQSNIRSNNYSQNKNVLISIKRKNKLQIMIVTYDQECHSLKIINKSQVQYKSQSQSTILMGKCIDIQNNYYLISSDSRNNKKKLLSKLHYKIEQNIVNTQIQMKLKNQNSGYLNTSQIQSIPQQSNQSSVMKSYPNQRQQQFQQQQFGQKQFQQKYKQYQQQKKLKSRQIKQIQIKQKKQTKQKQSKQKQKQHFNYQVKRIQMSKNKTASGPNSQVNRSSVLSQQFDSDIQQSRQINDQILRKKNQHSIEEKSSFYNGSNVYVPAYKSPRNQDIQNNSSFPQQQHLQTTLQKILVFEHIKRQKLQQKSKILEKSIKQSQRLAKLLTRYATHNEKSGHISRVKGYKEQLQVIWNKQIFYRRQIHNHFISQDLQNINRNKGGQKSKQKQLYDNNAKIDMKKLLIKYVIQED